MQTLLLLVELFVSVGLVVVILLQRSEGGALGMGGGGSGLGGLFSPRGASDTLTRTTAILAVLFFVTCLGLNIATRHAGKPASIIDTSGAPASQTAPKAPAGEQKAPAIPLPH